MAARIGWSPDRRGMIWVDCNPAVGREMRDFHPLLVLSPRAFKERTGMVVGLSMTTAAFNDANPFAVRWVGPRGAVSYILAHQPKSFDWRSRAAKAHAWKQAPVDIFDLARETLEQIVDLGS